MNRSFLKLALVVVFTTVFTSIKAQQDEDPVVLTIGNEQITRSEFLNFYNKNNNSQDEKITKADLDEYLNLFINFRMKVLDAKEKGLDTNAAFRSELNDYRTDLAKQYLFDKSTDEELYTEAYDRMQYCLRASHILIRLDPNASPKDTLAAWKKIMDIRKRAINGEDFAQLAIENSQDPSVNGREHGKGWRGDIGYFTAFDTYYPFETAAYNLKVGEISMPVRTSQGYHLIKLTDRIKSFGKVQVSQIFLAKPKVASDSVAQVIQQKIDEIKQKIAAGEDFFALVKQYSDDKRTQNGMLPWFEAKTIVPEFAKGVSLLTKPGDVTSDPIETFLGFHFVKLINLQKQDSYEELRPTLQQNVERDERSHRSKEQTVEKLKKEYDFVENTKNLNQVYALVDTTIYQENWTVPQIEKYNKPLFTLADTVALQKDFIDYLSNKQTLLQRSSDVKVFAKQTYKNFVEDFVMNYEDSRLSSKYPEFRMLYNEYHDGILLFNILDAEVWSKALIDTVGLEACYGRIKYKHLTPLSVSVNVLTANNAKTAQKVVKQLQNGGNLEQILAKLNKKNTVVTNKATKLEQSQDATFDNIYDWSAPSIKTLTADKVVYHITNVNKPEPKSLDDIRGIVITQYQKELEENWIAKLRKRYAYKVNQEELNKLTK